MIVSRRTRSHSTRGLACLAALCLSLAGLFSSAAAEPALTRDERWRQDLRCLVETLPRVHKNAFFQISREEFHQTAARLDAAIPSLRDHEIVVGLARLAAKIGDAHTALSVFDPAACFRFYPISFHWFQDGLYVTMVSAEYSRALGARLLTVGRASVQEACAAVAEVISHENEAMLKSLVPSCLVTAEVLHATRLVPSMDEALFGFEDAGGRFELSMIPVALNQVASSQSSIQWLAAPDPASIQPPLYLRQRQLYYWYKYLPEHRTIYFQYNSCRDMPERKFSTFARELLDFVDGNTVERFIVDLRLNGGGNSTILQPLIQGLRRRPSINRPGHLFVLIGRRTFSSAILNALELRNKIQAVLVGEPTGGRPNHYGEVKTFKLPHSGLTVTYSTKYFRHAKEDTPSLIPDVLVEPVAADYFAGRDPVLDAVLDY
ncbi:MAG: hypothetical protein ACM3X6_03880 [Patescibacteria group bacterium]